MNLLSRADGFSAKDPSQSRNSKLPLSQGEWTLVAYYCLQGAETFANTAQTEISYDSLTGILEAFQAAYELLRKRNKTHLDSFFLAAICPRIGKPKRRATTKSEAMMCGAL